MKDYALGYWASLSTSARVSLVLFVAICLLWARSYWRFDGFTTDKGLDTCMVTDGVVIWKHRTAPEADYINASGPSKGLFILGIGAMRTPALPMGHLWTTELPFWVLAAVTGYRPTRGLLRFRRMRLREWRVRHQLCVQCGFDLRASPDRCPECGAEAKPQAAGPC